MQMFLVDEDLDKEYLGNGGGHGGGGPSSGGGGYGASGGCDGDGGGCAGSGAGAGAGNAYGPDTLLDYDVEPRQCMALKYTAAALEQCRNKATLVFEPEDESSGPAGQRRRHVVCACAVHGEGSSAVLQRTDLRYPVRQLDDLRIICKAISLGAKHEDYRQCLRMTAEQARKYTSATDWCALQRELQKKKAADGRYLCAYGGCRAVPKRFYAQYGADLSGERQADEVDLICVCGKPGCNTALDESSVWKLVYTHEDLRRKTKQQGNLDKNMKEFIEWAN